MVKEGIEKKSKWNDEEKQGRIGAGTQEKK